ncbi:hypothetical protein SAMN05421544_1311, partial [Riemerella columbipharyngis]
FIIKKFVIYFVGLEKGYTFALANQGWLAAK